jgi:hypothetical protein
VVTSTDNPHLALSLLMLRILATDNHYYAIAPDYLAMLTTRFYRGAHFHGCPAFQIVLHMSAVKTSAHRTEITLCMPPAGERTCRYSPGSRNSEMIPQDAAFSSRLTVPLSWITGAESPDSYEVRYTSMCEQRTHSPTSTQKSINCFRFRITKRK